MDFHYFVGIDIAKDTLDWAVFSQQGVQLRLHKPNSVEGIKDALRQIKSLPAWSAPHTVFCMEHNGIYNTHLLTFLHQTGSARLESSLQIKQAGGMQRG